MWLAVHVSLEVLDTVRKESLSKLRKTSLDSKPGSTDVHTDVTKDSNASVAQDAVFGW